MIEKLREVCLFSQLDVDKRQTYREGLECKYRRLTVDCTEANCPLGTEDIAQVKELESTIDKLKRAYLEMETYTICGGAYKEAK